MNGFELSPKQVEILKQLHKRHKDRRAADKIKAIVLLGTGWSVQQVSEALLLDHDTLRSYVQKYKEGNIANVLSTNYKGSNSRLSDKQKNELEKHLSEFTYSDVKSIIAYVKKEYGVGYKLTRMREILRDLGFTYKKPIEIIFLPAYSPFLNLIERVWKYFSRKILNNKYYATFSEFKNACLNFLNRKHKKAFKKILVEKFHFSGGNIDMLKPKLHPR